MFSGRTRAAFVAIIAALVGTLPASAQSDPFYNGKRITLLVNFAAGGPADIEGRLFAKHFGKHIDGAPNIIVQNRDGAAGLVGTKALIVSPELRAFIANYVKKTNR